MEATEYEPGRLACERLVVDFLNHIDHKDFKKAADLFTEDSLWARLSDSLSGPRQIFEVISSRPSAQRERHVVSNIQLVARREGALEMLAYVMTFRTNVEADTVAPVIPGASGIADFHYEFREDGGEWKIHRLSSRQIFVFG